MLNTEKRDQRPLRRLVYDELKSRILTGQIAPGERMMEEETSKDLGVSRTPVREAFKRLEKEGLVEIKPRRGAFATQISKKDLIEILDIREVLETMAAEQACVNMKKAQKDKLKSIAEKHRDAVADNDFTKMVDYDTEFHEVLVEGSNNKTLINFIEQLSELVLRFRYVFYENQKRPQKVAEEHARIMEAIMSGDSETAGAETKNHIMGLKQVVREFDFKAAAPLGE